MTLDPVSGIAVAALGGAAIGVERQRSGHASGPDARFGGVRTFTLVGGASGVSGLLWSEGSAVLAALILASLLAIVVAGYVAAMRRDIDATTEVAGVIVIAAGVLSGSGNLALASGIIAATALLLVEKSRLHSLVARIDDADLRAAFRFAVMAVVVLPLLPEGPYGPLGGFRPRQLLAIVLFFSGLSFAAYIARRALGTAHGHAVAGLLGGVLSSTNVTLTYARASRAERSPRTALAAGTLGASTVLVPRVMVAVAVLAPHMLRPLAFYLLAPFAVGAAGTFIGLRNAHEPDHVEQEDHNPLQLTSALQMALLFQTVLFAVAWVRQVWGSAGLAASGAVLGLTDVDALTISMARVSFSTGPWMAARAIAVGVLANTLLKMTLAVAIGRGTFRVMAGGGLALMALGSGVMLWLAR